MPKKVAGTTLYSIKDLNKILELSKPTLRRYFRTVKIRGRKIGTEWYTTEENLRKYLNGEEED